MLEIAEMLARIKFQGFFVLFRNTSTYSWSEFVKIVDENTLKPLWSTQAGWIYTANLKGGGTGNNRQYGKTLPIMPTIDLLNHNTPPLNGQPFAQVNEVKFPYTQPVCPAATSSC